MIKNYIYKPNNDIIGEVRLLDDHIEIDNKNKQPIVYIYDIEIIDIFNSKKFNVDIGLKLYNDYNLCINEIAAIFGIFYNQVFYEIRYLEKAGEHAGRRNSIYGKQRSQNTKNKLSYKSSNRRIINNGIEEKFINYGENLPEGFKFGRLPFSVEHRQKIREAGLAGKYTSGHDRAQIGWIRGKFDNVNFKRGIGGYFTSIKMSQKFFFRSLLELYYIIYFLEENDAVFNFQYEKLRIKMDNGRIYTPDIIINKNTVIELKAYDYIYNQGGIIQETFEYKVEQGKKYCENNGLIYKVVFDKDINFNYKKLKHELIENNYIEKYNIEFLEPERVFGHKK